MVSGKTSKSKAITMGEPHSRSLMLHNVIKILGIVVVAGAITLIIVAVLAIHRDETIGEEETTQTITTSDSDTVESSETGTKLPEKIDFKPLVDEWVSNTGGNRSVLIYDLERDEMVASYNIGEDYNTASLYKLFVVYEGYRRAQNGEWDRADKAGSTGYTIAKCLDLAIRESNSVCAETLWGMIGHDTLDNIVEKDFGITNSDVSHLVSNPEDVMKMMRIFYEHSDITDKTLLAQMRDSFLNQPTTEYNWRQGLPSGFTHAMVYNKVGWDWNGSSWNIYHDAAIVEFPEFNRHFIVVVMTSQVPYQRITELGRKIEAEVDAAENR